MSRDFKNDQERYWYNLQITLWELADKILMEIEKKKDGWEGHSKAKRIVTEAYVLGMEAVNKLVVDEAKEAEESMEEAKG